MMIIPEWAKVYNLLLNTLEDLRYGRDRIKRLEKKRKDYVRNKGSDSFMLAYYRCEMRKQRKRNRLNKKERDLLNRRLSLEMRAAGLKRIPKVVRVMR